MTHRLARLRWQLTLSHLLAIVVTLVSMVAALMMIAGGWIAVQTSPDREASNDARTIARAVGPLAELGTDRGSLDVVLRTLAQGTLRAQIGPGPFAPEPASRMEGVGPALRNVAWVAIVFELTGVIVVGALSLLAPVLFGHDSVWSYFGMGYLFIPLVLPVFGLWWLRTHRPQGKSA